MMLAQESYCLINNFDKNSTLATTLGRRIQNMGKQELPPMIPIETCHARTNGIVLPRMIPRTRGGALRLFVLN